MAEKLAERGIEALARKHTLALVDQDYEQYADLVSAAYNVVTDALTEFANQSWIKITDDPKTLPQVGVPVLVSWDRGPFRGWVRESMYLGDTTPQWKGFAPTHWTPLPAPPAAEQT